MADNKNRLTTRERIVAEKVDEARSSVIQHQLELEFLTAFNEKAQKGEVKLTGGIYAPEVLNNLITNLTDCCTYDLERLNFYKKVRDDIEQKKIEKAAKKAEAELAKYPETINTANLVEANK